MILEKIKEPIDIQLLKSEDLKVLAREVRQRIVDVVSTTGGHIAPSLGAVDLTIALLRVFDPRKDKIVWDVGHQSYGWKILTGRNDRFESLRTFGGISGFTNRDESEYDAFSTGHSSTSISAALGLACGSRMLDEDNHNIAVIGDGALTGGMSFEALNHAGHIQPNKFVVILNDNAMSISKNVGGLQKYMAHMMASKSYNALKQQVWEMSGSLPESIRRRFIYGAQKLEESMLNILVPNIIFEDLGFKYVGPIDGHDIKQLTSILHRVKYNMVGPVLIHVVTQKGKGYIPAERDSTHYHGISPRVSKSSGEVCGGGESWSEVFGKSVCRLAANNPKVVAITAAMSSGTGLSTFEETYPDRFYDVGIAEQHAVTLAAGMACKGIKPFVAIYSSFFQRALDQIIHDVALPKLPVVFCIDRAGLVGEDGATHHGAFDISFLSCVPNLRIFAPSDAEDLDAMLEYAAGCTDGPVCIRYPRGTALCSAREVAAFQPGKSVLLESEGDITLISVGDTLGMVRDIHANLSAKGVKAKLVDLKSIKPLDAELLNKLADECSHIFTFESNVITGGVGSAIGQLLAVKQCRVINFGYPDAFVPHGKTSDLTASIGFCAADLSERILKLI